MTPTKKKGSNEASHFLDNLTEFLGNSEAQDLNDLKSELREEGIAVDTFILKVKDMISVKSSEAKRSWIAEAKAGRTEALKQMNEYSLDIPKDASTIMEKLREIIVGGGDRDLAGAYFRNLKDMHYEDLEELYKDYLKLQHLKKITNERKNTK